MINHKIVLITGSTSGIGKSFANLFAQKGYHLVLVSRDVEKLNIQTKQIIEEYGIKVYTIACDLAQKNAAVEVYQELKNTGVSITTLCPGATKTEFAAKAGIEDSLLFKVFAMNPEKVARIGYKALMKGKMSVIAGTYNKLLVFSSCILPKEVVNFICKKMYGFT